MTDQQRRVNARTFREWYELLEETVTHDEDAVAPGNSRSAVMLLHDLVGVGLRIGAVRLVVSRSTGPRGFSHLSFRYPLDQAFDWREDIAFSPEGSTTDERSNSSRRSKTKPASTPKTTDWSQ
jgi:hypothetical protein